MKSIDQQVEEEIKKKKEREVFFSEDFDKLGKPLAVNVSLHRIEKRGLITRLARGVYVKPTSSKSERDILPSIEEVAIALARRDKARILPTGAMAQYKLGLSTQIPLKAVYLSDGTPRKIKIDKNTIQFKTATPKILSLEGEISKLVVLSLKSIGKKGVNPDEELKLIKLLKEESRNDLKHDISLAPQWIAEIMAKAL